MIPFLGKIVLKYTIKKLNLGINIQVLENIKDF